MTEAELRAIDGPTLTRLAWEWGLAPRYATVDEEDPAIYRVPLFPEAPGYDWGWWEPHANLAQADAVFRGLRARGWSTKTDHYAPLGYGEVRVYGHARSLCVPYEGETAEAEASALLRCAVLAVWSDRKET